MYNGHKILELLSEGRFKQRDLLEHMGIKENGTVARFVQGDIRASRLEQIADFFGVSIDTLFTRNGNIVNDGVMIAGDNATARNISIGSSAQLQVAQERIKSLERELKAKNELLAEKDKNIHLLAELLKVFKEGK